MTADLRQRGFQPSVIEHMLNNGTVWAELYDYLEYRRPGLMADPDWSARVQAKDPDALYEMDLLSANRVCGRGPSNSEHCAPIIAAMEAARVRRRNFF